MGAAIKPVVQRDDHLPTYPLVWLDGLMNKSEENLDGQRAIRSAIDHLKTLNLLLHVKNIFDRFLTKNELFSLSVVDYVEKSLHESSNFAKFLPFIFTVSINQQMKNAQNNTKK